MKHTLFFRIIILICGITLVSFSPLKGVKKNTLPNGMKCLLKEDHSQPIVSVQVWVRAGSVNEQENINGISHFFEHMVFKGTDKYPGSAISRTVETNGGNINAATSSEYTIYYIDIPSFAVEQAVAILADAMMNCTFPEDEMEKERKVILEEIKRKDDQPDAPLWDNLRDELYRATPYKYRIIGSSTVINALSRDDLLSFYQTHYHPKNMLLTLVGDCRIGQAKKLIKKYFNAPPVKKDIQIPSLIEPVRDAYRVIRAERPVKQVYLEAGFLGPAFDSNDQYALDLAAIILGQGKTSRLYRTLREEQKIVWSIGSSFYTRTGSGLFTISATCDPLYKDDVLSGIKQEIASFITKPPSQKELARAKNIIKNQWIFDNETYHAQASNLGYFGVLDKLEFMKKYQARIKRVSPEDVIRVFKKYITEERMAVSMVVPQ